MSKDNKRKLGNDYNKIVEWFDEGRRKDLSYEKKYLKLITEHTPEGGSILDVGCGTAEPLAKFFIDAGYKVTGVDASERMIDLCKYRYPNQHWLVADMRNLILDKQFDVVLIWHSLFHLPYSQHEQTLKSLAKYVKSHGILVFTSGSELGEEYSNNGGCDLYHASLASDDYKRILQDNYFNILQYQLRDEECGGASVWVSQRQR